MHPNALTMLIFASIACILSNGSKFVAPPVENQMLDDSLDFSQSEHLETLGRFAGNWMSQPNREIRNLLFTSKDDVLLDIIDQLAPNYFTLAHIPHSDASLTKIKLEKVGFWDFDGEFKRQENSGEDEVWNFTDTKKSSASKSYGVKAHPVCDLGLESNRVRISHLQCRTSMFYSKPCEFIESEYVLDPQGTMMEQNVSVHYLTKDASKRFKQILGARGECPNIDSELVKRKQSETLTFYWERVKAAKVILSKHAKQIKEEYRSSDFTILGI